MSCGKDLQDLYGGKRPDTKFSREYAMQQICEFREAMGLKTNSIDKLDRMFGGLFLVVARTDGDIPGWEALCVEWPRRRCYMELM